MKKYRCVVCEWVYDPAVGDPDGGIAPGTPFEEIPDDWSCPVCGKPLPVQTGLLGVVVIPVQKCPHCGTRIP